MDNGFVFAGKSASDFDMLVEHYPDQKGPVRKRTVISVPGRNGDLHYDEGTYENYPQKYKCGFYSKKPTPEQAHAVKEWLLSSVGYQRLEDVYDPDHFRLAEFTGPLDIENQLNKIGKCVITFDCAPQSFLKIGEQSIFFEEGGVLLNPTGFTALPLIRVYGNGAGSVTVGEITVQISSMDQHLVLDCDTQNAYNEMENTVNNWNSKISAPVFPQLLPGENPISWTGGVERLEIIPRWWTL